MYAMLLCYSRHDKMYLFLCRQLSKSCCDFGRHGFNLLTHDGYPLVHRTLMPVCAGTHSLQYLPPNRTFSQPAGDTFISMQWHS